MRADYINKYSLDLVVPVSLIVLAEMLIFLGHMQAAMIIHAFNLTLLVLSAIYLEGRIFAALMLLPLFRLVNVAMPVFFQLTLYSYPLIYAPMFIPIYVIIKEKIFTSSEMGLTLKDFWFYLPLAAAVGFSLGYGEYRVLNAEVLIPDFSIRNVLALSLSMIFFVGLVEEFVFRSALQTVMEERIGSVVGLLVTSVLFAFMHSGYHLPLELLYVFLAGMLFGVLFWVTRSLPIIAVAHGLTNVSLFLVSPAFPEILIYIIGVSGSLFVVLTLFLGRFPPKIELYRPL
jgi:membrane protease YdiL (CAAX protease family)